ncbi:MAG: hypothetical protein ACRCUS_00025, partial [Anaerovoracaceae bacterium]
MKKLGNIEQYQLSITCKTPLHIGNGVEISKLNYIFDRRKGVVTVINPERLMNIVIKENLVDEYESYIFNRANRLREFLSQNNIN